MIRVCSGLKVYGIGGTRVQQYKDRVRDLKLCVQKIKFYQFAVKFLNIQRFYEFLWVQNSLSDKSVGAAAPAATTLTWPLQDFPLMHFSCFQRSTLFESIFRAS